MLKVKREYRIQILILVSWKSQQSRLGTHRDAIVGIIPTVHSAILRAAKVCKRLVANRIGSHRITNDLLFWEQLG